MESRHAQQTASPLLWRHASELPEDWQIWVMSPRPGQSIYQCGFMPPNRILLVKFSNSAPAVAEKFMIITDGPAGYAPADPRKPTQGPKL